MGVKHGGNRSKSSNGTIAMTDQDIAAMNGIDINTLKRAKSLTTACHAAALSKNNCFKMLKNAIIKRFFGIFKFHRMASA